MKKILITGARSGIAKALIERLKNKDYLIYACVHTLKECNRLKEIYKDYKNIVTFKMDITNESDIEIIDNLDIDILFCNAAICNGGNLIEINLDKVKENYEVNVFGTLALIQRYLNNNIRREGKIIIMSSLSGIIPLKFIGAYSSTKASLIKIGETLKLELKLLNSRMKVCLIEPGLYKTGFNEYMFMHKPGYDSYFDEVIELINKEEFIISNILSKKSTDSIINKIESAIRSKNPRFIYRAPLSHVIFGKIYNLFKG